jgi:hypothetical protein
MENKTFYHSLNIEIKNFIIYECISIDSPLSGGFKIEINKI